MSASALDGMALWKLAKKWRGAIAGIRDHLDSVPWDQTTWDELRQILEKAAGTEGSSRATSNLIVAVLGCARDRDEEQAAALGEQVIDRARSPEVLRALINVHLRLGDVARANELLSELPRDEWSARTSVRMQPPPGVATYEASVLSSLGPDTLGQTADALVVDDGDDAWLAQTTDGVAGAHLLSPSTRDVGGVVDSDSHWSPDAFDGEALDEHQIGDAIEALDGFFGGYRIIHARGRALADELSSRKSLYRRVAIPDVTELGEPLASDVRTTCLAPTAEVDGRTGRRVVIAGHDLKFAGELESMLKRTGHTVIRDRWSYSRPLNLRRSKRLADWAEVVLCEWGLANAVWYSRHLPPDKRLVVRVHLQELLGRGIELARRIDHHRVDSFILVADELVEPARRELSWPPDKLEFIPNYVNTSAFARPKLPAAAFNLAIVGVSPRRKRLDLALDVIARVREQDPRFKLLIKGTHPLEHDWVRERDDERRYFETQLARIEEDARLGESVVWHAHSARLYDWYRDIGAVLSPSDFESFHYSVAEGAASGALPLVWPWDGAERTYRADWLVADAADAASRTLQRLGDCFDP
ncbi:MAG: glycosyltransferase, partial [Deltaproteobacteria bacterium]|nr:glycosyltransferase [Deltaproteobacteria bacterium]